MLSSQKRVSFLIEAACECMQIRKYIASRVLIVWYNTFVQLYSHERKNSNLKVKIAEKLSYFVTAFKNGVGEICGI